MDWIASAPQMLLGRRRATRGPTNPLAAFYRSGTILAHFSTDQVARDGAGNIIGFDNLGGAGAALNAVVAGPALPQQGNTAIFQADGASFAQLPAPLDLIGVRLLWIMSGAQIVQGMRLFSHDATGAPHLRFNVQADGVALQVVFGGTAVSLLPRLPLPEGLAVYELEMTAATATLFVNGVQIASATHSFAEMPVSRIGIGHSTNPSPFAGRLGEILGVVLGRPDTANAIAAARARLDAKMIDGPSSEGVPSFLLSSIYGVGPGEIPMRHNFAVAPLNESGNLVSSPNAGGAGSLFDLTPGSPAIPVVGGRLDMSPAMYLRFSNTVAATRPNLMDTHVFVVADLRDLTIDQYILGNSLPQANVWIEAGGGRLRLSRRNPVTSSFETVNVNLSPAISGARRIYGIEFTGTHVRVFVNGELRGSAPHPYPEFRVLDFAAGQNPANGNGLNAFVSEVTSLILGGEAQSRIPLVLQRLAQIHGVAL